MKKVALYSGLLLAGLAASQALPALLPEQALAPFGTAARLATMVCLAFIMIGVGREFEVGSGGVRQYRWDYVVAATAAGFPWIFAAVYFVFALSPEGSWTSFDAWKQALLGARFASPTSAGVLFAMLAAAGLAGTWAYRKARVLAIFDDLDTVLLMVPLKAMIVGLRWQLLVVIAVMAVLLWSGWKWRRAVKLPASWRWLLVYSAVIVGACELVHLASLRIDDVVPVHIEVLLPAFVLGMVMAGGHGHGHSAADERAGSLVTGSFMVFVGLSLPPIASAAGSQGFPSWGAIAVHVAVITVLANLGKMFPVFCYRREASLRERLALCVAMWPRGEVGAGVLVISLSYGLAIAPFTVALLCLALNLVCTGLFILVVKRLLAEPRPTAGGPPSRKELISC